ncbi:hypothetical protein BJV78DRAFT_1236376 [Lactifluus subvellereus]|nr:hypothetical protein BJV78DRAFT_1236376 [Lactifluus subvellereus]
MMTWTLPMQGPPAPRSLRSEGLSPTSLQMPVRVTLPFPREHQGSSQHCIYIIVNATKNSTAPDSISTSAMPRPAVISTPGAPPLGKSKKTLGERKAKGAVDLPPRYTEELEAADEAPVHGVKTIKPPLVLALERQQREKQGAQKRTVTKPLPHEQAVEPKVPRRPPLATKQTLPPAQRELEESDSDDSDVPLAKKHAERARLPCDAPATLSKGKEDEPLPPKKRRGAKTKALPAGDDASDEASSRTKLKLAPQAPPPTKSARVRVGPGGAGKARVLQEKSAPTNAPRKRKERTKAMIDAAKGENEHEHEPPRKRSRRVDPVVSRRRKEDEEITRSAREASRVMMDRPLPSPVKQPAAHRKPASKAKLPSRTGAVQAPRSRGLPLAVLRRIKINAQALPALDDIDDDDPIDFLR